MQTSERKRATIRDVAALAGVDTSLVSRVLNDHPKASAAPATRVRILAAAETLGYRPNAAARGLRMARTWTLGLLLPNFANPMYADIARAAEQRAQERGFGLVVGTHVEGEEEETFTRLLQQSRVDGLLVASGTLGDAFLRRFARGGHGPVVLVNRRVRGVRPAVTVDDAAGAALATQHLIQLGHKRIAGIFGPAEIDTSRRRRDGFTTSAAEAGVHSTIIEAGRWDAAAGHRAATKFFEKQSRITGVLASSFAIGMGTLRAASELGIIVPQDVSVIALHDSELADYLSPRLTTVALPVNEMAYRAVDTLIDLIDGQTPANSMVRTKPELVLRDSTGKRKSND